MMLWRGMAGAFGMDFAVMGVTELSGRIRAGELSAEEALDAALARVERVNGAVNAVVHVAESRARARARALDGASGDKSGLLYGAPMTVKDAWEVAGMRSTGGSPSLSEHVPVRTADAVLRLEAAGAVIFGKTNVPLMSGDLQTYNAVYGVTENPWRAGFTPGGSSGGAAAATAAGLTAAEFGSDIGGSIRTPAHFCGVFGLKPSWGAISMRGHVPPPPGAQGEPDLAACGPLARRAEDLETLFDATLGPASIDAAGMRLAPPPPRCEGAKGLRVAVWSDDPFCPPSGATRAAVSRVGGLLADAGARVEEIGFPLDGMTMESMFEVYAMRLHPITLAGLPSAQRAALIDAGERTASDDRSPVGLMARAAAMRAWETYVWRERQARIEARLANEVFNRFDVIVCPVAMRAAFEHDHSSFFARTLEVDGVSRPYSDMLVWIALATLARLPAVTVPAGRDESGMPVGVQVIGPRLEDRTPIQVAKTLEALGCAFEAPPLLSSPAA